MSWRVANICADRKFGSPVRKQIIMFLADKASDDGSGIYCSKGAVKRHTELGASTVKRTIGDFIQEGILVETGQIRRCTNGYTVVYRMNLSAVETLEKISEPSDKIQDSTGSAEGGVHGAPGTSPATDRVPVPKRTPNHPKTIRKPPSRELEAADIEKAEKVLAAYPADKIRDRRTSLQEISVALEEGVSAEDLQDATSGYARETDGYTRSKVCFSDNWFKMRRWEKGIAEVRKNREEAREAEEKSRACVVEWIRDGHPLCRHITARQLDDLLAAELVTKDQIRAAGLVA